MLVELEIRAENTLPVTCFEQIRLLRRADVSSLLNRRFSGIFDQTPSDRLGDRSDYALDFTAEETTERRRHDGRHGRKHYMVITGTTRENRRMLARQNRSQLCAILLSSQRICERHESHRHQPTGLRVRVLGDGIKFQRLR